MMDNYEIHEWSQTRPVVTVCHVCTASVTVGVDAQEEHWPNEGDR